MPVTTYLTESECNKPTSNSNINILLDRVRTATGRNWQISESNFTEVTGWGFLRKKRVLYYLYVEIEWPEFQIINLSEDGLGYGVEAGYVTAYLYGILAGKAH